MQNGDYCVYYPWKLGNIIWIFPVLVRECSVTWPVYTNGWERKYLMDYNMGHFPSIETCSTNKVVKWTVQDEQTKN